MSPSDSLQQFHEMAFLHRRLSVFREAVAWTARAEEVTREVPRQWRWLREQLLRASGSIALNTAEGSTESGTPQERRFYRMARGSVAECDACLAILQHAGVITEAFAQEADDTLNRLSAMLRGLIRHSESRKRI
jgi:four helix bundle protein